MFEGRDVMALSRSELCSFRGNRAAMIFQEPMTSLNPVMTSGSMMLESSSAHPLEPLADARARGGDAGPSPHSRSAERRATTRTSSRAACASACDRDGAGRAIRRC